MEQEQNIDGIDPIFVVRAGIPRKWKDGDTPDARLHWNLITDERIRNPIYVDANVGQGLLRVICDGRIKLHHMIQALEERGFTKVREEEGGARTGWNRLFKKR